MTLEWSDIKRLVGKDLVSILGEDVEWAEDLIRRFPYLSGDHDDISLSGPDREPGDTIRSTCRNWECRGAVKAGNPCRHMRLNQVLQIYQELKFRPMMVDSDAPSYRSPVIQGGLPYTNRRKH